MTYRHPTAAEREAIWDLIADSFPNPRARQPEVRASLSADPDYAPDRTIVAADEQGRIVGHAACQATELSLGGARLPVARLGTVCTAADARRQGLGARLVEAAAALAPQAAAVVLDPAPHRYVEVFYEGLGFVAARRSRPLREVMAGRLPAVAAAGRLAAADDVPALAAIYEAHYGHQIGCLKRTAAWWRRRVRREALLWSDLRPEIRVAERDGAPVAYIVSTDDDGLRVWEWAGAEPEAWALLADEARRAGPRFSILITPRDPLWPALERIDPADVAPEPTAFMVRARPGRRLTEVLTTVLAAGGATLAPDRDEAILRLGAARLTTDWHRLLALVYDGRVLEEWVRQRHARIEPNQAAADFAELLPPRQAGRRLTDAF
jgi:predicted N-acetyltransferase YhbS